MDERFWREKWALDHVPFHQSEINERLRRFFPEHVPSPRRVLAPLSGKSRDLLWLLDNTEAAVVANELVEQAVRAFYDETGIAFTRRDATPFAIYDSGRLRTYVGDFFSLPAVIEEPFDAVYDRGALVAIPPSERLRYARRIDRLTVKGSRYLLLALEYDQTALAGPPFSLPAAEVEEVFGARFNVDVLERLHKTKHAFSQDGLDALTETTYLLRKR